MFQQLPTAGLPFQFDDLGGVRGVRPRPADHRRDRGPHRDPLGPAARRRKLGTIENRVCDGVSDLRELAALAALMHCLVVDLDDRLAAGEKLPTMPPWHVQENKWRAARYGLDADHHPRRRLQRAAGHRRPRRPARAARRRSPRGSAARTSCASVADIPRHGASYQRQRAVAATHRRRPGRRRRLGRPRAARVTRAESRLSSRPAARPISSRTPSSRTGRSRSTRSSSETAASASTPGSLVGAGRVRLRLTVMNGR